MANPSDCQNCWVSCVLVSISSLQLTCALRCQDLKQVLLKSFLCVFMFAHQHFPIVCKTTTSCLQEYFETQAFDSIFVVNTTFSRVGKQTSAPTGNGLTGYQARPSFADSCWAFALTNPSGLTSTSLPLPEGSADLWTAGNWSQHSAAHPKQISWHLWGKFPHLIEAQLWLSCIDRGAVSRILSSFYWQLRSKYGPPRSLMGDADNLCR